MKLTPAQIDEISQILQCGLRCFVHRESGEIISVPKQADLDMHDTECWEEDLDKLKEDALNYFEVEQMSSHDSFQVMEDFAETTPSALNARLLLALSQRKPFSHFKNIVDDAGEWREHWFAFRDERYRDLVRQQVDFETKRDSFA